ncbi:MAG: protein kinase [Xanthomonadales bacterium]|nr:protein kinase [Xanthomonadales bacterium]
MADKDEQRLIEAIADGKPLPDGDGTPSSGIKAVQSLVEAFRGASSEDPVSGNLFRWRHLQVIEEIGEGGFGKVYRAYDTVLKRDVALKLGRDGERGANLVAEARRMAQLRHPNILAIHGADQSDGKAGIWCDLLSGETLEQMLARHGALDGDQALAIIDPLIQALKEIHYAGLTHGDIKASNIMIQPDGQPVLMDFGAGGKSGASAAVSGSPMVMAPELFDGQPLTPASDVYSLGVLVYLMLTGRYPVEADSLDQLIQQLGESRPDYSPIPRRFRSLVERCLAQQAADRPAAADLAQELAQITARPHRRRRVLVATVVIMSLVIAAGTVIYSRLAPPVPSVAEIAKPENSVAVLPLENLSDDQESRFFTDGLSEEILHQLSGYRDMHVVARATSFAFRDAELSTRVLTDRLRVRYLLMGSVRTDGQSLRINARLVDESSQTLWSESFDGVMQDVFKLQEDIAAAVARRMSDTIAGSLRVADTYQPRVEAYQQFLLGREYVRARSPGFEAAAMKHFDSAARLDPQYAAPLAGRAIVFHLAPQRAALAEDRGFAARQALDAALALDPDDPYVLAAQGLVLTIETDYPAAEKALRRAYEADRNLAGVPTWLFNALVLQGKTAEANQVIAEALALNPLDPRMATNLANRYSEEGEFELSENLLLRLLDLPNPPQPAYRQLFDIYGSYGKFDRVIQAGKRWILAEADAGANPHFYMSHVAYGYARLGLFEQAETWQSRAEAVTPVDPFTLLRRVYIARLRGDTETMERLIMGMLQAPGMNLERMPPFVARIVGAVRVAREDYAEGIAVMEPTFGWDRPMPYDLYGIELMQVLAYAHQQLGNQERAREILLYVDQGLAHQRDSGKGGPDFEGLQAINHSLLGNGDAAIQAFQNAYDAGYRHYYALAHDDRVKPLRADPRFVQFMESMLADVERQRAIVQAEDARDRFWERLEGRLAGD